LMEWIIFVILCLLLWLLPLPFGGNAEWAVLVLEVTIWILFLAYIAVLLPSKSEVGGRARSTIERAVLWLVILFFLTGGLQLIPLPAGLVGTISPAAQSWRQSLVTVGLFQPGKFGLQTLSLSPWASAYELIRYITYGAFVFLLARTLNSRVRITVLTVTLISAGVFQSLYGLSEFFGGTNRIFTWVNKYYSGSAFGTFVNRDHYSAFLEMLFPLSLGYFLVRSEFFSLRPGLNWRQKLARFGQEHVQKSLLFIIPPLIIGLGLFFSRCRSGIIIFIVIFFVTLIMLSVSAESNRPGTEKKLVRVVVLVVLLAVVLVGIDPVLERFTREGFIDKSRLLFYRHTIQLVSDYPLTGCGLGTYAQAINYYLPRDPGVIVSHAHNDYLEMLAESGLIGGLSLIIAGFLAFSLSLRKWLICRNPLAKGVGLGALMGVLAIFMHSLTDFSLRMPGNALVWLSLLVLAIKTPAVLEKEEGRP
ncbi:MAG: O-antigen ligase family protein, partial [Candidatus Saccharicenans sp.]